MNEVFLRVFGPAVPAAITLLVLDAIDYKEPSVGLFFALWGLWLIVLNGGFLLLDEL